LQDEKVANGIKHVACLSVRRRGGKRADACQPNGFHGKLSP
jgi:hypothetical protein